MVTLNISLDSFHIMETELFPNSQEEAVTPRNPLGNETSDFNGSLNSQQLKIHTPGCMLFKFVLYSVAMGILCILGFLGNTVSYLVLRKDRSTRVASFLLQALAVADNTFLVLWTIHYSIKEVFRYSGVDEHLHGPWLYLRVYSFPVLYMTQTLTIWLTVTIAMNRFMAVCMPYKAPHLCSINNVFKEVAIVTVFSILYNVPRFFELRLYNEISGNITYTKWDRTKLGNSSVYQTVYVDALYYLFSFVLPLLILAFVNTRVTIAYHAARQRKRRMTTRRAENENNITLVMIIVVLSFMLCQAPARIVQLVWNYNYHHCEVVQFYLIHISNTLEVLNSSINFLIYFMFRKRFRDILWSNFCVGPLVSRRRDSARLTTTEGLSLVQVEHSQLPAQDICNNDTVDPIATVEPINGNYKPPDEFNISEEVAEQSYSANEPLRP